MITLAPNLSSQPSLALVALNKVKFSPQNLYHSKLKKQRRFWPIEISSETWKVVNARPTRGGSLAGQAVIYRRRLSSPRYHHKNTHVTVYEVHSVMLNTGTIHHWPPSIPILSGLSIAFPFPPYVFHLQSGRRVRTFQLTSSGFPPSSRPAPQKERAPIR